MYDEFDLIWQDVLDEDIFKELEDAFKKTFNQDGLVPPAEVTQELQPEPSYGVVCSKCLGFFEHATHNQKDGGFKCYSCRNY